MVIIVQQWYSDPVEFCLRALTRSRLRLPVKAGATRSPKGRLDGVPLTIADSVVRVELVGWIPTGGCVGRSPMSAFAQRRNGRRAPRGK
jgi:hypothetical protein